MEIYILVVMLLQVIGAFSETLKFFQDGNLAHFAGAGFGLGLVVWGAILLL